MTSNSRIFFNLTQRITMREAMNHAYFTRPRTSKERSVSPSSATVSLVVETAAVAADEIGELTWEQLPVDQKVLDFIKEPVHELMLSDSRQLELGRSSWSGYFPAAFPSFSHIHPLYLYPILVSILVSSHRTHHTSWSYLPVLSMIDLQV